MRSRRMLGKIAAAVMALLAITGAAFADEYADAVRNISSPPRAAGAVGAREFSLWDGTSKTRPTIDDDTVKITSAAELAWLATGEANSSLTGSVKIDIDADIDLGGHEWTPIPLQADIELKGNGHVIKGLTINSPIDSIGMFSAVDGEFTANDLHLVGVDVGVELNGGSNASAIGSLIAEVTDYVTILGCTVQGRIHSDSADAVGGGFVGKARGGATIKRSVADIAIVLNGTGYDSIGGGLIGSVVGGTGCFAEDSAVYGSVYVKGRAASGIIGLVDTIGVNGTDFYELTNNAAVTLVGAGSDTDSASFGAGGIIGVASDTAINILSSANYGAIKAEGAGASTGGDLAAGAGGLLGAIFGEDMPNGANDYALRIGMSANLGAVSSTMTGSVPPANQASLGAGGFVGSSYYKADQANSAAFVPSITGSRNTGAVTGNDTNSAGGMIGYLSTVSTLKPDAATVGITASYNTGAVSAPKGSAGGIVGSLKGGQINGGGQNTTMDMSQVYSSAVPTGNDAYGFFGTYDANGVTLNNFTDAKHTNGIPGAWASEGGSYAANMKDRNTFVKRDGGGIWDGYLDNGTLPPELDRRRANDFTADLTCILRSATTTRLANGDVTLSFVELPDVAVRATDADRLTYEASIDGAVIARGLRVDGGVLTIPANDALVDGAVIEIVASAVDIDPQIVYLSLNIEQDDPTPPIGGEIVAVAVRGTPLTPSEDATIPLYLEWTDTDGATHSDDLYPEGDPTITWSIVEPNAPNWDVSIAEGTNDQYHATLSISERKAPTPSYQEFAVQVRVSYPGEEDEIVYTRKFFAGAFPTQVLLGPDQQEMIDAANAVLARTNVSILPGNFQPVISDAFIAILEQRIADGLVHYVTDRGIVASEVRAADDPRKVYVLNDMRQIEALMTPTDPEPESLPVCFESCGKQSANISLDISESRLEDVAPDAVGKIVLLPMTYSVTFESDDMTDLFGEVADEVLTDPRSELSLGRIFQVLVLHKRIKEGDMSGWYTRLVSGVATPIDARDLGMMEVDADKDARELTVRLAYNVINYAGESFVISDRANTSGLGYIILPDGLYNSTLIDPLWPNIWKRSQDDGGSTGGGGGGCDAGIFAPLALAALAVIRRRTK